MSAQVKGIFSDMAANYDWKVHLAEQILNWTDSMFEDDRIVMLPLVEKTTKKYQFFILIPGNSVVLGFVVSGLEASIWRSLWNPNSTYM